MRLIEGRLQLLQLLFREDGTVSPFPLWGWRRVVMVVVVQAVVMVARSVRHRHTHGGGRCSSCTYSCGGMRHVASRGVEVWVGHGCEQDSVYKIKTWVAEY